MEPPCRLITGCGPKSNVLTVIWFLCKSFIMFWRVESYLVSPPYAYSPSRSSSSTYLTLLNSSFVGLKPPFTSILLLELKLCYCELVVA